MSEKQYKKVVVTDYNYTDLTIEERELVQWNAQVVPAQCTTPEEVIKVGKDADALISQYAPITAEVIANLDRCKAIGRYGIGVDNIDVAAATARGIAVINVPSYCEDEVSDHALAMLLAWARRIPHYTEEIRRGTWDWKTGCPIYRLRGQVLSLLGFGKIARLLARKAKALGLEVIAYDPYLADEVFGREDVKRVTLDDLFAQSDFLSVHVPLTSETRHLINEKALAQMKPTVCIINTSRGPVVDEAALAKAIQEGVIAGACLDVMEEEPPANNNPLLQLDQVIFSPHVGWYSEEAQTELRGKIAEDIGRALTGVRPYGLVNKELASRFRER
ncbi:MAG: C-terminal binding protein [Palaeococcus sp.]|uniref:C-terminal binding protein n=1 Tax=Palaeococcus sp. (in: euryarchaeotes) TaxID=2820298 RepID=UPI0025FC4BA4|nr:C-terminal binding protein [Palaeococcus sp. (in: euryarchaeotes)]MCD6558619.1 C-terminal binding protein [Palaeococcus sp. (in: euryarchaeotes)]